MLQCLQAKTSLPVPSHLSSFVDTVSMDCSTVTSNRQFHFVSLLLSDCIPMSPQYPTWPPCSLSPSSATLQNHLTISNSLLNLPSQYSTLTMQENGACEDLDLDLDLGPHLCLSMLMNCNPEASWIGLSFTLSWWLSTLKEREIYLNFLFYIHFSVFF